MNWKAPSIAVTLRGDSVAASVVKMDLQAHRGRPVAVLELELSNLRGEMSDGASDGDTLSLQWGYRGDELAPLFDGTVKRATLRETLKITALCRARALTDTVLTRTYHNETINAIAEHLTGPLGFASLDFADSPETIDKLPLYGDTVLSAFDWMSRRMGYDRALWADAEGGLHWQPVDETTEPVASLVDGEDILALDPLPLGGLRLTTVGVQVSPSEIVEVTDRDSVLRNYYVEGVRHTAGVFGPGTRTILTLREVTA